MNVQDTQIGPECKCQVGCIGDPICGCTCNDEQMNACATRLELNNFIGSRFISNDEASDSDSDSSDSDHRAYRRKRKLNASPTDYKNKEDSAEDYFGMNELADEAPTEDIDPKDDYDDIEEVIPAAKDASNHSDKNGDTTILCLLHPETQPL
jgi:hypothetical protein